MQRLLITSAFGICCGAAWAVAEEPAPAPAAPWVRPEMRALRVPDGAIKIDGDVADWAVFGTAFTSVTKDAVFPAALRYGNPDRGPWLGPDDLSLAVAVAADTANLYVLANVRDQLLFNDSDPKEAWQGDDIEVFVDANPRGAQFAATRNENAHQFIFIPAWVDPLARAGLIWKADENPGVKLASRLHPWGYTLEVQIPKALFPNWQQHPDLDAIGFDVTVADADAPGMDGGHGAYKQVGFLLSPAGHFMTSEKLGCLVFDADVAAAAPVIGAGKDPIPRPAGDLPDRAAAGKELAAQDVLDLIGGARAGPVAAVAVASADAEVRRSGLLVLAKRPELPAPTDALLKLCAPTPDGTYQPAEIANYALVALAARKQLPAKDWFDFYNHAADPQIRLAWPWCCMVNGDKSVTPQLQDLLSDQNTRVRLKAAMALGELADATALPALEKLRASDAYLYGHGPVDAAIKGIEKRAAPAK